ncbi:hypothetical protein [Methylobacterium radiodurans]|uniref:Uncharacterized protein n=1 Tax=Methylobacterium radiodurans TaxID=2202828 RepID=A0A2U8VPJ3_9HYPH|nr:hypothetical protein [Methylobacterium radiodurans]AWN35398.1 hypothetical protein DK427_06360 [Methylobacterium radiodurans]
MPTQVFRLTLVLLAAGGLAACQSTAAAPPPVAAVAAPIAAPAVLPQGSGCGPAIARTQAVVSADVASGDLAKTVGDRFGADLDRAASACAAGRAGEALSLLAAAKSRYGYP